MQHSTSFAIMHWNMHANRNTNTQCKPQTDATLTEPSLLPFSIRALRALRFLILLIFSYHLCLLPFQHPTSYCGSDLGLLCPGFHTPAHLSLHLHSSLLCLFPRLIFSWNQPHLAFFCPPWLIDSHLGSPFLPCCSWLGKADQFKLVWVTPGFSVFTLVGPDS